MKYFLKDKSKKPTKFWFKGEKLSEGDFDKLPWGEVHASNNLITDFRKLKRPTPNNEKKEKGENENV